MIVRPFKADDIEEVMAIWMDCNAEVHHYIPEDYWAAHFDEVRQAILNAAVFIAEENSRIIGFMGIVENYIAGIFIKKEFRSCGAGSKLLNRAKSVSEQLSLDVYAKNRRAWHFYCSNGFTEVERHICPSTGEVEIRMEFR